MTQYSTNADFSTDSAGSTIGGGGVTNWTEDRVTGNWDGTLVATGDHGGLSCDVDANGSGTGLYTAYMTDVGAIADNTETDFLFRFRADALVNNVFIGMFRGAAGSGNLYSLMMQTDGDVFLVLQNGSTYTSTIGSPASGFLSEDTWTWCRVNVTAAGAWSCNIWTGNYADEGSATSFGSGTNTTQPGGYAGIASNSHNVLGIEFDWFSVGTAGDAAPSPGGGGSSTALPLLNAYYG